MSGFECRRRDGVSGLDREPLKQRVAAKSLRRTALMQAVTSNSWELPVIARGL